ncbi:MAG: hypothetical protein H0W71_08005 [Sphingomonas sp.]|nr:hypothetical protein [Sphingomonas sp.]
MRAIYIQARMARLHQRMHFANESSHERYNAYGYGGYQPSYGGYDLSDGDDNHHHDGDD